jgi:hypothetical protein
MSRETLYAEGFRKIALAYADGLGGSEFENWVNQVIVETMEQEGKSND